jgi:hypothetical protein
VIVIGLRPIFPTRHSSPEPHGSLVLESHSNPTVVSLPSPHPALLLAHCWGAPGQQSCPVAHRVPPHGKLVVLTAFACTRSPVEQRRESVQSWPLGMRQQTRLFEHSASTRHATIGQHFRPTFIAASKSSWVEHGMHASEVGAGCGDASRPSAVNASAVDAWMGVGDLAADFPSTHTLFSQTRSPLQSESFEHPVLCPVFWQPAKVIVKVIQAPT